MKIMSIIAALLMTVALNAQAQNTGADQGSAPAAGQEMKKEDKAMAKKEKKAKKKKNKKGSAAAPATTETK